MVIGKDISHYEGEFDFSKVEEDTKFIISKASEGLAKDIQFENNLVGTKNIKRFNGSYHYYRNQVDPEGQAKFFFDTVTAVLNTHQIKLDFPPILDVENINNPQLEQDKIYTCLLEIEKLFKRKPIIYTGYYVWRDDVHSPAWSISYQLWLASYTKIPLIPPPWTDYLLWQFTSKPIDTNYFQGTEQELIHFLNPIRTYYLPLIRG
jgi:lysozyme